MKPKLPNAMYTVGLSPGFHIGTAHEAGPGGPPTHVVLVFDVVLEDDSVGKMRPLMMTFEMARQLQSGLAEQLERYP